MSKLEYARVLHKALLMPVLLCGSETTVWRGGEVYDYDWEDEQP